MNIEGRHFRTIWLKEGDPGTVQIINQQVLPFKFEIMDLHTAEDICRAIKEMYVRGAGLIGAAAAYGIYLATLEAKEKSWEERISWAVEGDITVVGA